MPPRTRSLPTRAYLAALGGRRPRARKPRSICYLAAASMLSACAPNEGVDGTTIPVATAQTRVTQGRQQEVLAAQRACAIEGFREFFFESFLPWPNGRERYVADHILVINDGEVEQQSRSLYLRGQPGFPLAMVDSRWVTAESAYSEDVELEPVELTLDRLSDHIHRVRWRRVRRSQEGQPPGPTETYGPQGELIFELMDGCWKLSQDLIWPTPQQGW